MCSVCVCGVGGGGGGWICLGYFCNTALNLQTRFTDYWAERCKMCKNFNEKYFGKILRTVTYLVYLVFMFYDSKKKIFKKQQSKTE